MDIGSATTQALHGMQRSQDELVRSARDIARLNAPIVQPSAGQSASELQVVEPLVNLERQQQIFDSNARVIKTADEMLGNLIDTTV